ncbi:MAG: signal recognition particle protein [SAR324 cluster bacterium]|nr:signal recognition particle protein [SAR324 cluster bacterium]MCH8886401.1 signal recognition particle protein [SAR324 cluster bacterium]
MFESLQEKLSGALSKIRGRSRLTASNIEEALGQVRVALLEADVNFRVVRAFLNTVQERALGEEVPGGISAGQYFIQIVSDELAAMMGGEHQGLNLEGPAPAVIMLVGLQGSGKTSTIGKLAKLLRDEGRKPYLVSTDVYRPAAIDQLRALAETLDVPCYDSKPTDDPVEIARAAVDAGRKAGADAVLIDTAGRLQIDEELMAELDRMKAAVNPREMLYVADGLTGQDAVNTAQTFHERLELTGHVLTKMDGDARGGAALSIRAVTQQPIKFITVGEKLENLERFHPDRIASRILGMGDLVSLIEKAQETFDEEKALELQRKMASNAFTLSDFLDQLRAIRSMGPLKELMDMVPGMSGMVKNTNVDEGQLKKVEAIICSMTLRERENHQIINMSRRNRIAKGSGTRSNDVNKMLKQFSQMRKMMKKLGRLGGDPRRMEQSLGAMAPGGGMPPGGPFQH